MIIYKATNVINNKVYIGQTIKELKIRKSQHEKSFNYGRDYLFPRAIRKYGKDNFKWEIIYRANNIEELNDMEAFYIEKYDSTNPLKGYNIKQGGKNKPMPISIRSKISKAQIGKLNHMFGKKGIENKTSKKVIDLSTNKIYGSAMECARELGISNSKISAVCRGERATTNNKIFRYVDDDFKIIEPITLCKPKQKKVMNIDTGEVFDSVKEAEIKYAGSYNGNVGRVCQGKRKTAMGYRWKYVD